MRIRLADRGVVDDTMARWDDVGEKLRCEMPRWDALADLTDAFEVVVLEMEVRLGNIASNSMIPAEEPSQFEGSL